MELASLWYNKTIPVHFLHSGKFFPGLPAQQDKDTVLHPVRIPRKEAAKSLFFVTMLVIRRTFLIGQLHRY